MKTEMYTEVKLITPQIAKQMLSMNRDNRQLRPSHVKTLVGIIERGEMELTHQGIAFSADGRLLDGQHRLKAIELSGIAVPLMVTYNVTGYAGMDRGAVRQIGDLLGVNKRAIEPIQYLARLMYGQANCTAGTVEPLWRSLGILALSVHGWYPGAVRLRTAAPVRLAAIVSLQEGQQREYVAEMYSALARRESTPEVLNAFSKRELAGKMVATGTQGSSELLYCALAVFDEACRDNSRLAMYEDTGRRAIARAVAVGKRAVETVNYRKGNSNG